MRAFNNNFEHFLSSHNSEFRFTVEISFDDAGTILVYFPSHADAGRPASATLVDNSLAAISAVSQRLDNRHARTQLGGLTLTVGDYDGATRALLNAKYVAGASPIRKRVVIYAGFKGMDWVNYEPVDTYYIDDVDNISSGWNLRATDIQKEANKTIFVPDTSTLSSSITASSTTIPLTLAATTGVFETVEHDSFYSDRPSQTVGYIKIDKEIITHSGFTGTSLNVVQRGALNTVAVAHEADASRGENRRKKVEEYIYLEGRAIDILHQILVGESIDGLRTIPNNWNSEINTTLVETATFDSIGEDIYTASSGIPVKFVGIKKKDALKFAEQQIMRWCGVYQGISSRGTIQLKRYQRRTSQAASAFELNNTNLLNVGNLKYDSDSLVNIIDVNWAQNPDTQKTTRITTLFDAESIALHSKAKAESFDFIGVNTGIHTDADIRTYFDTFRDLYSNPPYRISVTVNKSAMRVEVGDVVRLNTHLLGDFIEDTDIDRTFEVEQRKIDFKKAEVSLSLIGSSRPASVILPPELGGSTGELNNTWITSTGTNLETLSQVTNGVITADVTLTGHADANNSAAIYYIDDDLTINDGVTVTIVDNVQIRYTGFLTVNGTIDGKGNGHTGALGSYADVAYAGMGTAGALGITLPGHSLWVHNPTPTTIPDLAYNIGVHGDGYSAFPAAISFTNFNQIRASAIHPVGVPVPGVSTGPFSEALTSLPVYNLTNTDGALTGIPSDLRGSSGGAGIHVFSSAWNGIDYTRTVVLNGGDGGDGGAGLILIGRGISFGASGSIDTSGTDGTISGTYIKNGKTYYAGSGAGGAPGGVVVIIDGDFTPPSLTAKHTCNLGDSPVPPTAIPITSADVIFREPGPLGPVSTDSDTESPAIANPRSGAGYTGRSYGEAASRVQFVPSLGGPEETEQEAPIRQLAQVTGVSISSGVNYVLIHANGNVQERARVTWTSLGDADVTGYQVQARQTGDPDWITVETPNGPDDLIAFFDVEDGTQYDVRVRAVTTVFGVTHGIWSSTANHTAVGVSALTAMAAPVLGVIDSGIDQILITSSGGTERIKLNWTAPTDPLWTGTEIQYKKVADSAWESLPVINDSSIVSTYIVGVEGGTNYDIRLRHLSRTRPDSSFTATTHVAEAIAAIVAPTSLIVDSGIARILIVNGAGIERIKLVWAASTDQYWTGTEIQYKKIADSDWESLPLINDSSVLLAYIEGVEGGVNYDIRIRHLSNIRPDSSFNSTTHITEAIAAIATPTGVSLSSGTSELLTMSTGTILERIKIEWTASTDQYWTGTEIEFRESGSAEWKSLPLISSTDVEAIFISGGAGVSYDLRMRHISTVKPSSSYWTYNNYILVGKAENPADVTGFTASIVGNDVIGSWNNITDADRFGYRLRYGGSDFDTATQINDIPDPSNQYIGLPVVGGLNTFRIKAIDTGGRLSTNVTNTTLNVTPEGAPTINPEVLDNFVLLRWTPQENGSFPIAEYEVRKGDVFSTAEVIGRINGRFTSIFEFESGTYKYWVVAIDIKGIQGTEASVTTQVSQPPDFVLRASGYDDDFSGTKTNVLLDDGALILPIPTTRTWAQHFTDNSWTTIQAQITAGYDIYVLPSTTTASYEREFDLGAIISSSTITFAIDIESLSGSITVTPTISFKEAALDSWTDAPVGDWLAYGTDFRYIKITLNVTASGGDDLSRITAINYRVDSRLRSDAGSGTAVSTDTGGTTVNFNYPFVDVESINVTPLSTNALIATYDFTDVANPTSFSVYIWNTSGTRVSANFSWSVRGY